MERPAPSKRSDYCWFTPVTLRWNDIDVFGHVNNAQFYEFFDTAVVRFLTAVTSLGPEGETMMMVVAESGCRYLREARFSDELVMGLRIERVGTSSVRYGLAAFLGGSDDAAAEGHFIHVALDRETRRPTPLTPALRAHFDAFAAN